MPIRQRVIGLVFILLGCGILYFVPVSRVACSKRGSDVGCTIERKIAGLIPRASIRLPRVSGAEVRAVSSSATEQRSTSSTYQLYFQTPAGEVGPAGCDAVNDPARLEEIADEVLRVVSSEGEAEFTRRTINRFPIFAAAIFLVFGILAQLG